VRTILIVVVTKAIEGALLVGHRGVRRRGGVLFERAMHALVTAVLLRLPGLDALGQNAQLNPPHAEPRETPDGFGGEGRAVVATNPHRQPELAKGQLEVPTYRIFFRLAEPRPASSAPEDERRRERNRRKRERQGRWGF
jgi:hypothetical protein